MFTPEYSDWTCCPVIRIDGCCTKNSGAVMHAKEDDDSCHDGATLH